MSNKKPYVTQKRRYKVELFNSPITKSEAKGNITGIQFLTNDGDDVSVGDVAIVIKLKNGEQIPVYAEVNGTIKRGNISEKYEIRRLEEKGDFYLTNHTISINSEEMSHDIVGYEEYDGGLSFLNRKMIEKAPEFVKDKTKHRILRQDTKTKYKKFFSKKAEKNGQIVDDPLVLASKLFSDGMWDLYQHKYTEDKYQPLETLHTIRLYAKFIATLNAEYENIQKCGGFYQYVKAKDWQEYIRQLIENTEYLADIKPSKTWSRTDDDKFREWTMRSIEEVKANLEQFLEKEKIATIGTMSMDDCIDVFIKNLSEASVDDLIKDNQAKVVSLYKALDDAFKRNNLIELNRLASVPNDVHRINQIETIIDLYTLKIDRVKKDKELSEEERDRKIQAWTHLMEKDIEALGGAT